VLHKLKDDLRALFDLRYPPLSVTSCDDLHCLWKARNARRLEQMECRDGLVTILGNGFDRLTGMLSESVRHKTPIYDHLNCRSVMMVARTCNNVGFCLFCVTVCNCVLGFWAWVVTFIINNNFDLNKCPAFLRWAVVRSLLHPHERRSRFLKFSQAIGCPCSTQKIFRSKTQFVFCGKERSRRLFWSPKGRWQGMEKCWSSPWTRRLESQ